MEEKPRRARFTVPGVTLFGDEIRELAGLFSRRFGTVYIETDRFTRVSGDEFFEKSIETRPSGLTISDTDGRVFPNLSVRFGSGGAEVVASDTRTSEDAMQEIKRYLEARRSWLARYRASPTAKLAFAVLVAAALALAVWLHAPEAWWWGLVLSGFIAVLLTAAVELALLSERHSRAVVVMDSPRSEASFWQRNRDLAVALVEAMLAGAFALAAAALGAYLTK